MPYQQQIDSCFRETIDGAAITRAELKPFIDPAAGPLQAIKARRAEFPLWQLPSRRDDLAALLEPADAFARFETVVLFGTGGSSLGGQTLAALAAASNGLGHRPRLVFVDSLPAQGMLQLFAGLKLEQSGFIVISKSGSTAEAMAQILVAMPLHLITYGLERIAKQLHKYISMNESPIAIISNAMIASA